MMTLNLRSLTSVFGCRLAVAVLAVGLAVALLASPAFAQGTATYLGTNTAAAGNVLIDGTGLGSNATVTYAGGTITIESPVGLFSGPFLPDEENLEMHLFGDGTYIVEIAAIDVGTRTGTDHMGFYLDETTLFTSQVWMGFTTDGSGGYTASLGVGATGSMDAGNAGNVARGPISLPATVVLTRTGDNVAATINNVAFGTAVMLDGAVDHIVRLFDEGSGGGSISYSSITVAGVGIADVNLRPTVTITRNGALDSAFTDTTGSWNVFFSEDVLNVDSTDFSLSFGGDADASGPFVSGWGSPYTAAISAVTGTSGTISLNFNVDDVISAGSMLAPLPTNSGLQWFSNILPAPAAMGWALVFLAVVLALAAAVMLRKKALKH